jgi:hypothetical protein
MGLALLIAQLASQLAPVVIPAIETIFSKKPKSGPQKAEAALQMAQAAIIAAIGIDPKAFGPAEQALVSAINDAMVAYYNSKGWPTPTA